jgi:glucan biosynthesis protein
LKLAGLAPLTSLFAFGPNDRVGIDDFRTAAHDSDGLAIWNGKGEWLWRPLRNPETLQISEFIDDNPRGFGLLQRHRTFADYQDLEANYERRPSLWIEPIGYWGSGAVAVHCRRGAQCARAALAAVQYSRPRSWDHIGVDGSSRRAKTPALLSVR